MKYGPLDIRPSHDDVPVIAELRVPFRHPWLFSYWGLLSGVSHGPKVWPRWKRFAFGPLLDLNVTAPSTGTRLWLYTRAGGRHCDLYIDRRPESVRDPSITVSLLLIAINAALLVVALSVPSLQVRADCTVFAFLTAVLGLVRAAPLFAAKLRRVGRYYLDLVDAASGDPTMEGDRRSAAWARLWGRDVAQTCTRPPHAESPCNGYPRPDCPGYAAWASREVVE